MNNLADAIEWWVLFTHHRVFLGFIHPAAFASKMRTDPFFYSSMRRMWRRTMADRGDNTWLYYGRNFTEVS